MSEVHVPPILMLDVRADHIATGEAGDTRSCAVARALLDATGAREVAVEASDHLRVFLPDGDRVDYVGPKRVDEFINRFDGYRLGEFGIRADVKPTTFRLRRVGGH